MSVYNLHKVEAAAGAPAADENEREDMKMACFLVPTAEAIVVKVIEKHTAKKENLKEASLESTGVNVPESSSKVPMSRKLHFLCNLLIGGAVLLAFEHLWHGEVVPYFPFLTAMGNSADAAAMLHEMSTTGVMMSVFVTGAWAALSAAADRLLKRGTAEKIDREEA